MASRICCRRLAARLIPWRYKKRAATPPAVAQPDEEPESLELEGGADVDRLVVAALVVQGRQPVAIPLVADAAGQRDPSRQRIGAADIERHIVAPAQCGKRPAVGPVGADRDPACEAF